MMWGFNAIECCEDAARAYFERHQQKLERVYQEAVLRFPVVDGADEDAVDSENGDSMRSFLRKANYMVANATCAKNGRRDDSSGELNYQLNHFWEDEAIVALTNAVEVMMTERLLHDETGHFVGNKEKTSISDETTTELWQMKKVDTNDYVGTVGRHGHLLNESLSSRASSILSKIVDANERCIQVIDCGEDECGNEISEFEIDPTELRTLNSLLTADTGGSKITINENVPVGEDKVLREQDVPVHEPQTRNGNMMPKLLNERSNAIFQKLLQQNHPMMEISTLDMPIQWIWDLSSNEIDISPCFKDETLHDQEVQKKSNAITAPDSIIVIQRVRYEEEELRMSRRFFRDESIQRFRKIVRQNAHVVLLGETVAPNLFDQLQSALSTRGQQPQFHMFSDFAPGDFPSDEDPLQLILLPSHLSSHDESKINEAPAKIKAIASNTLRSSTRLASSLTNATLNIPSIWNLDVVLAITECCYEEKQLWSEHSDMQSNAGNTLKEVDVTTTETAKSAKLHDHLASISCDAENSLLASPPCELKITKQPVKLVAVASDEEPFTTEDLVNGFLVMKPDQICADKANVNKTMKASKSLETDVQSPEDNLIQLLARPALWDLVRKKVIRVTSKSMQCALENISLEMLESIIAELQLRIKKLIMNPSAVPHNQLFDTCNSFRQVAWLHTLRLISVCWMQPHGHSRLAMVAQIMTSSKYRKAIGSSHYKDLSRLHHALGGVVSPTKITHVSRVDEIDSSEPQQKKQKTMSEVQEVLPVRVLCSVHFLEMDDLLDELCSEYNVSVIERDLVPPIDLIIDERNAICVVKDAIFHVLDEMKSFTYKLAAAQSQFQKLWIIIALETPAVPKVQENLHTFFAALVHFRIDTQTFTSNSIEETSRYIRLIIDCCAEVAMDRYRTLPRMWFERPFLLEEESQHERFLASTQVVNPYAAQSLLHKISLEDLCTQRLDRLRLMIQDAVTEEQLELLWR